MDLKELKEKLIIKKPVPLPLIFNANKSDFLVNEYLVEVAKNFKLNVCNVSSIGEIDDVVSSMLYDDSTLFVCKAKEDSIIKQSDLPTDKVIIVYETQNKSKTDIEEVTFCKLEGWMIEDYIKTLLPGLPKGEVSQLAAMCNYNMDRISLECSKLKIFDEDEQQSLFELMLNEGAYSDLSTGNIFNLTNAVVKKDIVAAKNGIKHFGLSNVDPFSLISILIKNFSNIISIQLGRNTSAEKLGMKDNQFQALKYNCNKYSSDKLINVFEFLNSLDYKVKSGLLDMDPENLVVYVLGNIL